MTKTNKPYLELTFADATGSFQLKIWSDSAMYQKADEMKENEVVRLEGRWTQNQYGIDSRRRISHA